MMIETGTYKKEQIWNWLREITDPEIPVLNIVEMGIVRDVVIDEGGITIKITPTYSGCPATVAIEQNIRIKMADKEVGEVEVKKDFSEPWTTDWMGNEAKEKLKEYGIVPPNRTEKVHCPYCNTTDTQLRSEFGSTPCKSLYYCKRCEEPFERFKCI